MYLRIYYLIPYDALFLGHPVVATNVVASRLPECRPTGTPTARANYFNCKYICLQELCLTKWYRVRK